MLIGFQSEYGDCGPWTTPSNDVRMEPPNDTVAVAVDVRSGQGAINIVKKQGNKFVDKVGPMKGAKNLVIVRWQSDWWYYAIGDVQVAYIPKKS